MATSVASNMVTKLEHACTLYAHGEINKLSQLQKKKSVVGTNSNKQCLTYEIMLEPSIIKIDTMEVDTFILSNSKQ